MRQKEISVVSNVQGFTRITGEMKDERHHITVELFLNDQSFKIEKINLALHRIPRPGCRGSERNLQKLIGYSFLDPHFRRRLIRIIGGSRGCFHLLELLHEAQDYFRSLTMDTLPDDNGYYKISRINQAGRVRCIGYGGEE